MSLGLVLGAESVDDQRLIKARMVPLLANRPNLSIAPLVKGIGAVVAPRCRMTQSANLRFRASTRNRLL